MFLNTNYLFAATCLSVLVKPTWYQVTHDMDVSPVVPSLGGPRDRGSHETQTRGPEAEPRWRCWRRERPQTQTELLTSCVAWF